MIIRELAPADSIADLTALLHAAYAGLGGMGFNYTAVDQTEDVTRSRIARGLCLVAVDGGALVGTIMFHPPGRSGGCPCYERPDVATIGQFGTLPSRQGTGTGTRLLRQAEQLAAASGAAELALDTSEGADHRKRCGAAILPGWVLIVVGLLGAGSFELTLCLTLTTTRGLGIAG